MTPEPKGKLDAMTTAVSATRSMAGAVAVVNGPEGEILDWDAIDWRQVEEDVRRLRQRIFAASQAGDLKRVRNLQKLMLRSRANALVSVRRVTEINAGRKTAGRRRQGRGAAPEQGRTGRLDAAPRRAVDTPAGQAGVCAQGQRAPAPARDSRDRRPVPSGPDGRTRWNPSGRPGSSRGPTGSGPAGAATTRSWPSTRRRAAPNAKRLWVLDADLAAAFDRLDHDHILPSLGTFPARGLVAAVAEGGRDRGRLVHPDRGGSPSGRGDQPVLMNVALHGMESAAGVRYRPTGTQCRQDGAGLPGGGPLCRRSARAVSHP